MYRAKNIWRYDNELAFLRAAKRWGLTPKQWDALPKEERVTMLAVCAAEDDMAFIDSMMV